GCASSILLLAVNTERPRHHQQPTTAHPGPQQPGGHVHVGAGLRPAWTSVGTSTVRRRCGCAFSLVSSFLFGSSWFMKDSMFSRTTNSSVPRDCRERATTAARARATIGVGLGRALPNLGNRLPHLGIV